MTKYIKRFFNLGVRSSTPNFEKKKIYLFNIFCLTWYIIGTVLAILSLFDEVEGLLYLKSHFSFICLIAVAQFFHSKNYYLIGRIIYIFSLWLVAFVFANFIDVGGLHEFFYAIAPLIALIFIDNKYINIGILVFSILLFAIPNYFFKIYDFQIYNDASKYIWFVILFVIVNYFKNLTLSYQKELEELDEFKTKMFNNLSHEFRTPLTVIQGLSTKLEGQLSNYSAIENVQIIHKNASLLNEQLKQILAISALEKSNLKVSNIQANAVSFVKELTYLFASYASSKEQEIIFTSDVDKIIMDFDPDKLQSILQNLISNALKFNKKGGTITISAKQQNNQLILSVADAGIGIEKNNLDKIFDRFYTSSTETNTQGTGIGLAYVKELVELVKGNITVQSQINKGTTFIITLPITQIAKKPQKPIQPKLPFVYRNRNQPKNKKQPTEQHNFNKKTVLVVEDNKDIQTYYKQLLQEQFGVLQAYNGKEAQKLLQNKEVDLIICDLAMPEMSGFEFSKELKTKSELSHIPLIIISANVTTNAKTKSFDLGIDAYLTKPFKEEELLSIMNNLFEKQQQKTEYFSNLLSLKKADETQEIRTVEINFIKKLQELSLEKEIYTTQQLANKLAMSRSKLHQKVQSLTGMSVANYVKHIKIEKAKELLQNTEMQIGEIAFELGYASPSLFSKIFKKGTNQSPSQFKNNR